MKKLLLILALTPLFAMGQEEHVVKEYCLMTPWKLNNAKISTEKGDSVLCDSIGNKIKFKNNIEALNYMSKHGWELHSATHTDYGEPSLYILYRTKKEGE